LSDSPSPEDARAASAPPPTGRASRFFKLGALSTKVAASYLGSSITGIFRSKKGREAARRRAHEKNAARLAGVMTELKGAIMKIGQLISTQDGVVPVELRDRLAQFHCQAPPMHFLFVKDVIESELERPLDEGFAHFDREPLAAASLGQVHRATLPTGEDVAVKVQYPGIEDTIESDLKNLRRIVRSMRVAGQAYDLTEAFDEIRETLLREVDYVQEADSAERFGRALANTPGVVIPEIFRDQSSGRVLTMSYLEGKHLDAYCEAVPDPKGRAQVAERLARTIWDLEFRYGLLHADPHPGNYLFMKDDVLGVLDFGCVKVFEREFLEGYRDAVRAILDRDDERIIEAYLRMGIMKPEQRGTKLEEAYLKWSYLSCEPLLSDGAWQGDWEEFNQRLHREVNKMAITLGFYIPKDAVYLDRVLMGVLCFWNRLDVRLDWGRMIREVLDEPVELVS